MKIWQRSGGFYSEEPQQGEKALRFLYETVPGRVLLRAAVNPRASKWRARYQRSPRSKKDILPFAERLGIDLSGYNAEDFSCFNDFFTRQRGNRTDAAPNELVAIADSRLRVYDVADDPVLKIKHSLYTLHEIAGDTFNLTPFRGGKCLVFRLAVQDYHRYVFPDDGRVVKTASIPGVLHTVRPISERHRVYTRNTRVCTLLETEHFGTLLQVEVGAMLVGAIRNRPVTRFSRLEEKGYFEFGGSTILLFVPNTVAIDEDILAQSRMGFETQVTIGEKIGEIKGETACSSD